MKKIYENLPHTADIKIRAFGSNLEELFQNALKGMFLSIEPINQEGEIVKLDTIPQALTREHAFNLSAPNKELLLIDFLSETLYLSDVHNEAYFDARFTKATENALVGSIYGIQVQGFEVVEIKAVTYHDLKVEKVNDLWQAEIVFDI